MRKNLQSNRYCILGLRRHFNIHGSSCRPEKQVLLKFFAGDQFDLPRESLKSAQVMMVAVPRNHFRYNSLMIQI